MITTTKLSAQLIEQISNRIKKKPALKFQWEGNDELSSEQINDILQSTDKTQEVSSDLLENLTNEETLYEQEHLKEIVSFFMSEICEELDWDEDEVTDADIRDLIEENALNSILQEAGKGFDINLEGIIINTTPSIVLRLDLHHEYTWGDQIEYEQVEYILELLGINPKDIDPNFPDYPNRTDPIIKPADLLTLWRTAHNGGQYILALDLDLNDYIKNREHYQKAITIQKGSYLRLHDYWNGSSSIAVQLQKDLTILRSQIDYTFKEDRQSSNGLTRVFQSFTPDSTIIPVA
jgi:hypothetical protein